MNKYFKAARTRLHKYLVGELNCTLTNKYERSWYYKSSSLDLTIRISDHLSTRDEDMLDIVQDEMPVDVIEIGGELIEL